MGFNKHVEPISVEIAVIAVIGGESTGGHLARALVFVLVAPCLYSKVKLNCCKNNNQRIRWPPVSFMLFREVKGL